MTSSSARPASEPDSVEPYDLEGDGQVATPWSSRPGRRVRTSLGSARGNQPERDDDADDAVANALSPGNGRRQAVKRQARRRESFRRLPRLRPRERAWKVVLFAVVALAVSVGAAFAAAVLLPTTAPIDLPTRLAGLDMYFWPAATVAMLLVVFALASLLAGSFAAILVTALYAFAVVAGVAAMPDPVALLATSAATVLLLWLRTRRLLIGLAGGVLAGGAAWFAVESLVLPIAAVALAWPPRRPIIGTLRVTPPALAAALVFLGVVMWQSGSVGDALPTLRAIFARDTLLAWPGNVTLPTVLLMVAAMGAAALLVRSVAAGLFVGVWAATAWWSAGVFPLWPCVAAAVAVALHTVGNAPPTKLRMLMRPIAVGAVVALLAATIVPERMPDPSPSIERTGLAQAVAAAVPQDASVMVPDDATAEALRRQGLTVSQQRDADYLLVNAIDRRRIGRALAVNAERVVLRVHTQDAGVDARTQWVLVALGRGR